MRFATISTLRHTSQPALVIEDRVHTLPYPDMYAVMEAGAAKAAKKASKDSLAIDEVKLLSPLKPYTLRDAYAFGGGLHCCTADVYRDGDCEDYFPNA